MKHILATIMTGFLAWLGILQPAPVNNVGFSVVTNFRKTLSAPMSSSQSFFFLGNVLLPDGTPLSMSLLGDKAFFTIEPGGTKEEIVMCTAINTSTALVSGCTRGLSYSGTSTAAVSGNNKTHNSGSTVILSNVHYVYEQFVDTNGKDQTIAGNKTVTGTMTFTGPRPRFTTDTDSNDPLEFITHGELSRATSTGGGVNASTAVKGVVQESTTSSNFSGNPTGSTGARLFISPATLTTSSDYATKSGTIPVLRADSQLDSSFCGNPGSCAQLDANSKVVQNPASATSTPGVTSTVVMTSSTTGRLNPSFVGTSTVNGQILRSTSTGAFWSSPVTQITTTSPSPIDKTALRASGQTYYNSSSVAIHIVVDYSVYNDNDSSASIVFNLDTTTTAMYVLATAAHGGAQTSADSSEDSITFMVPPGWYYKFTAAVGGSAGGVANINKWTEILW